MIKSILPFVIGAAISPTVLLVTILVLSSRQRAMAKACCFALGAFITITIIGGFILVIHVPTTANTDPTIIDQIVHTVIGIALFVFAFRIYKKGKNKLESNKNVTKTNKSQKLIDYFGLGITMMLINVTTIMMYVPVSTTLSSDKVGYLVGIWVLLAMVLTSMLPILVPIAIILAMGKNSQKALNRMSTFMTHHGYQITSVFFGLLGVYAIVKTYLH